ncbi:hypothetical protein FA95DRAFT_1555309 [Auriscalpium vulgare]|uniref:Uncharacterized protein n=1 Tax=Auriscalpium vulgare TaxID=40419 RepID=A0ACB8S3T7_9AGAM|nr:hypothetical protein FA95DRAFT_1555309 [Auriscalpium vulgare]
MALPASRLNHAGPSHLYILAPTSTGPNVTPGPSPRAWLCLMLFLISVSVGGLPFVHSQSRCTEDTRAASSAQHQRCYSSLRFCAPGRTARASKSHSTYAHVSLWSVIAMACCAAPA